MGNPGNLTRKTVTAGPLHNQVVQDLRPWQQRLSHVPLLRKVK